MGYYKDNKYVYTEFDVQFGVCSQDTYDKQQREKEKIREHNNDGMDPEYRPEETNAD